MTGTEYLRRVKATGGSTDFDPERIWSRLGVVPIGWKLSAATLARLNEWKSNVRRF